MYRKLSNLPIPMNGQLKPVFYIQVWEKWRELKGIHAHIQISKIRTFSHQTLNKTLPPWPPKTLQYWLSWMTMTWVLLKFCQLGKHTIETAVFIGSAWFDGKLDMLAVDAIPFNVWRPPYFTGKLSRGKQMSAAILTSGHWASLFFLILLTEPSAAHKGSERRVSLGRFFFFEKY